MKAIDIKNFREKHNLTQSELAEISGTTIRAVQSWEQGQRNITQSVIKLLENYDKNGGIKTKADNHLIPFYDDVTSIGGNNDIVSNTEGISTPTDYIDAGDWFKDATAAIRHYGESMEEYPSGCILALKEVQDRELIIPGRDYTIETSEYRVTKRLQKGKSDTHITVYSTNSETYADGRLIHEPFDIPWRAISRISLVLGYVVKKNGGTVVFNSNKK
jgi:transcriptional regulator with XRE-family HTH domain